MAVEEIAGAVIAASGGDRHHRIGTADPKVERIAPCPIIWPEANANLLALQRDFDLLREPLRPLGSGKEGHLLSPTIRRMRIMPREASRFQRKRKSGGSFDPPLGNLVTFDGLSEFGTGAAVLIATLGPEAVELFLILGLAQIRDIGLEVPTLLLEPAPFLVKTFQFLPTILIESNVSTCRRSTAVLESRIEPKSFAGVLELRDSVTPKNIGQH